ncbi:MAG: hypothetical protein Q8P59_03465, partial [Dehalococcoidia bacterium]|nr:hypothetical protein [Dehalococcoidia bacterium]
VRETLLQDGPGRSPGELDVIRPQVDFQTARKMLMEVGEFGALSSPIKPTNPNSLVGTLERQARPPRDFEDFKNQLKKLVTQGRMEVVDGVEIDTEKATLLLRFLAVLNPAFGAAAMAMGVAALLHRAYEWSQGARETLKDWGKSLGDWSESPGPAAGREGAFYKEVPPMRDIEDEEWAQEELED